MQLSRRKLLKLSGGILAAAPFVRVQPALATLAEAEIKPIELPLGRALYRGAIYEKASNKSKVVGKFAAGDVLSFKGKTEGVGLSAYNITWYQTKDGGFVHSSLVYPADEKLNKPLTKIDERGLWGEVSVPFSSARVAADPKAAQRFPAYYGLMFRIVGVTQGADNKGWYEIKEDKWTTLLKKIPNSFVSAEHVRIVNPDEFDVINPNLPETKRLEINLKAQNMVAFEDDMPVYETRIASGMAGHNTPVGEHWLYVKTPGQRMFGGAAGGDGNYDLPGIPWISYFTPNGISFHGTYWHNDYGRPRSHGCANVSPADAKWIFRWSYPLMDYFAEDGFASVKGKDNLPTQATKVIVTAA